MCVFFTVTNRTSTILDAAAELGRNPACKHQIQPELSMEMNRLTRDGTIANSSRETEFSGANGDSEILVFPVLAG